ncbi:MAG: hypothetical protein NC930_03590 [Candidatus Omnitrophica bacterium]|nr:hypothetical protein [Candidatus Omnitrophota bacterium]
MILINLLPEEFRIQEKRPQKIPILPIVIASGALFVVLTIIFYIDFFVSSARLAKIDVEWKRIQPEAMALNQLRAEVENVLKPERDFLEKYVDTVRPLTEMLMWVSEFLPDSAWLTELKSERDEKGSRFLVKGLCVPSRKKSSIEQIEVYVQSLKQKMPTADLNLTTTSQKQENIRLMEFAALFNWKSDTGAPGVKP